MLVSTTSISKELGPHCILDDVSFSIEEQDKIAVLGVNGTGKSTFLKIIAGVETYEGKLISKSDLTISYLPQNPDFLATNTIMQQVYTMIDASKVPLYEIEAMLNKLGIVKYDQLVSELSGGQQKRVALAITLLTPCDLLILDEPTNHLDSDMIEYLEKYLIKFNKALLMVSHDRYFLNRVIHKIYEIDRHKIYEYPGNYTTYLELKEKREEEMLMAQNKRNSFLKKELEWVRAGVQARSTKSKDRLERFNQLNSMEKYEVANDVEMINIHQRLGKKTILFENVGMDYGENELFNGFSYTCTKTDRIGILGVNGSGKSTLMKMIAGELMPTNGKIIRGETVKLGYFKQGNDDMDPNMKVIDYIRSSSDDLLTSEGRFNTRTLCERFLFDSNLQHTPIGRLSGGQKRRLYLLKVLMEGPNVLLFDEPTNDLDIKTLNILEDYLDSFNGIVIVVCHDRYFLDRICDRIFVFKNKNIQVHNGGYSVYLDLDSKEVKDKTDKTAQYLAQKQIQRNATPRLSSKEKKELENMEATIEDVENKIHLIDEAMSLCGDRFDEISQLSSEREVLEKKLEELSERWMVLLEINEQMNLMKNK